MLDTGPIETTPNHPFYTADRGWIVAGALQIGERIRTATGTDATVVSFTIEQHPASMWDITVAGAHSFFVGSGAVLVHNCGPAGGYRYPEGKGPPVGMSEGTTPWEDFLGDGPYTNFHPRTGLPDPDRIVSADGTRSIRFGSHEMNTNPIHYHEEFWGDQGWGFEALWNISRKVWP